MKFDQCSFNDFFFPSDIAKTGPGNSNNDSTLNVTSGLLDNTGDGFKIVKKEKSDKYFQCPRCPKSFGNQDTLTKHGRFFHNISGTGYTLLFRIC